MHLLEKIIRGLCWAFFGAILLFLTIESILFTSVSSAGEGAHPTADLWWLNLLAVAAALMAAFWMLRRGIGPSPKAEKRWVLGLAAVLAAANVGCVLVSKSIPIFDQYLCIQTADMLGAGNGDWVDFYYLNFFPHQVPLVLFMGLISRLGGPENYLLFQLINAGANMISVWALAECAVLLSHKRCLRLLTWAGAIAFLPLTFYVTFIYGNLYGLCLMLLGARWLLKYLEQHKPWALVGAILSMTAGVLLKKNFLIGAIAAGVVLVLDALQNRRIQAAVGALLVVVLGLGAGRGVIALTSAITGVPLDQGFPTSSWIMLGLQDVEGSEPGWYNNSSYEAYTGSNRQRAGADAIARQTIRERLEVFAADPAYAAWFFYTKTVSQWNDPTFQCLEVNETARNPERGTLALSLYENGKAGKAAQWWMDRFHALLLAGALLWLALRKRPGKPGELLFPIMLVGGFLFHMVWEAKGQYTVFYIFCLLPYTGWGYLLTGERVCHWLQSRRFGRKITDGKV